MSKASVLVQPCAAVKQEVRNFARAQYIIETILENIPMLRADLAPVSSHVTLDLGYSIFSCRWMSLQLY